MCLVLNAQNIRFNGVLIKSMVFIYKLGVGVILVSVSAAAWRMTAPGSTQCLGIGSNELGRCGRRTGCTGRLPQFLYPEFQHRPPPPTYQASMQEYRLR